MSYKINKGTYWSLSKYGGELLRSGRNRASCTVEDMAGGSLRSTFTSSAITVNSTGSPVCVSAKISSTGFTNLISPGNDKTNKFVLEFASLPPLHCGSMFRQH